MLPHSSSSTNEQAVRSILLRQIIMQILKIPNSSKEFNSLHLP